MAVLALTRSLSLSFRRSFWKYQLRWDHYYCPAGGAPLRADVDELTVTIQKLLRCKVDQLTVTTQHCSLVSMRNQSDQLLTG